MSSVDLYEQRDLFAEPRYQLSGDFGYAKLEGNTWVCFDTKGKEHGRTCDDSVARKWCGGEVVFQR